MGAWWGLGIAYVQRNSVRPQVKWPVQSSSTSILIIFLSYVSLPSTEWRGYDVHPQSWCFSWAYDWWILIASISWGKKKDTWYNTTPRSLWFKDIQSLFYYYPPVFLFCWVFCRIKSTGTTASERPGLHMSPGSSSTLWEVVAVDPTHWDHPADTPCLRAASAAGYFYGHVNGCNRHDK